MQSCEQMNSKEIEMRYERLLEGEGGQKTISFRVSSKMMKAAEAARINIIPEGKTSDLLRTWLYLFCLPEILNEELEHFTDEEYPVHLELEDRMNWERAKHSVFQEIARAGNELKRLSKLITNLGLDYQAVFQKKRNAAYHKIQDASDAYADYRGSLLTGKEKSLENVKKEIEHILGFLPEDVEKYINEWEEFTVFMSLRPTLEEIRRKSDEEAAE